MKNNENKRSSILNDVSKYGSENNDLSLVLRMIFGMAWRVWKKYEGNVPELELERLEEDGDWPSGLAVPVMQRIGGDVDLRRQLEELLP
jgi:hypothetical protein